MNQKNNNEPMMLTLLTTTNHAPWIIPDKHRNEIPEFNSDFKGPFSESRRTMRYVDFALGKFIEEAKKQDWFENTIFIITADHGLNIFKDKINFLISEKAYYDPKSLLQEKLQYQNIDLPIYKSIKNKDGQFKVSLYIKNTLYAEAVGKRKIDAEKEAAKIALEKL